MSADALFDRPGNGRGRLGGSVFPRCGYAPPADIMMNWFADDIDLRLANMPPIIGREGAEAASQFRATRLTA